MRFSAIVGLVVLFGTQCWASHTDPEGGPVRREAVALEGYEPVAGDGQQFVQILPNNSPRWLIVLQKYRRPVLRRIAEFVPPLTAATIGTIVSAKADLQMIPRYLTFDWGGTFPYNKFFFPTVLLNQPLSNQLDPLFACYSSAGNYIGLPCSLAVMESLRDVLMFAPVVVLAGKEIYSRCTRPSWVERHWDPQPSYRIVTGKQVAKLVTAAAISAAGIYYLVWSKGLWDYMFTYDAPRALEGFNVSGAIEYCKDHVETGINTIWASMSCASSGALNMTQYMVPNPRGLPWMLCDHIRTSLPASDYVMLTIPILMLVFNWLYMVWWL